MAEIIDLANWRRAKEKPSEGVTILMGGERPGKLCPHCGAVLTHAMVMPSAEEGYACRDCDIWFGGLDDLYK